MQKAGKGQALGNTINRIIALICFVFLILLSVLSLIVFGTIDFNTYAEKHMLIFRSPIKVALYVLALIFLMILLKKILFAGAKTDSSKHGRRFIVEGVCSFLSFLISMWWIANNPYLPKYDAKNAWNTAKLIVYGGDFSNVENYYKMLPQQRGVALFFSAFIRLFGNHALLAFKIINALCLVLIILGVCKIAADISEKDESVAYVAPLMVLFLPLNLYSVYIYGTLISLAAVIWAFIFAYRVISNEKNQVLNLIITDLLLVLANSVYKGTLIATVAVIIVLLYNTLLIFRGHKIFVLKVTVAIGVLVLYMATSQKLVDNAFQKCTGIDVGRGLPSVAWVEMGITSVEDPDGGGALCGPGSYNFSIDRLYEEYGDDSKSASSQCLSDIKATFSEYFSGTREPSMLNFFSEKMEYQWCDPTFSSFTMTLFLFDEETKISDSFRQILSGSYMQNALKFLSYYMPLVYILAMIMVLYHIVKGGIHPALGLVEIYFIGGFVFQFFWESKSRYCLPYFVMLIPLCGIGLLFIEKRILPIIGKILHIEHIQ